MGLQDSAPGAGRQLKSWDEATLLDGSSPAVFPNSAPAATGTGGSLKNRETPRRPTVLGRRPTVSKKKSPLPLGEPTPVHQHRRHRVSGLLHVAVGNRYRSSTPVKVRPPPWGGGRIGSPSVAVESAKTSPSPNSRRPRNTSLPRWCPGPGEVDPHTGPVSGLLTRPLELARLPASFDPRTASQTHSPAVLLAAMYISRLRRGRRPDPGRRHRRR